MTGTGPAAATLRCNGVDALTGAYLLPDLPAGVVGALARGERPDPAVLRELRARHFGGQASYGLVAGLDRMDVADAGWGAVFAAGAPPEVRDALSPLLEHRRRQASERADRYHEFTGAGGAQPGEPSRQFLTRHGAAPGQPADPQRVPYYLLLVGDPDAIAFSFQYQLDVTYAVGRVCFDTVCEYRRYAEAVVAAETAPSGTLPNRRVCFIAARNADDPATGLSADHLVAPLAERVRKGFSDWGLSCLVGEGEATKANLGEVLTGPERPGLLFAAGHGVGFPAGHPRQRAHQGALLCQDWPGPRAWRGKPIPPDFYLSGEDLPERAAAPGLIAFLFACYGLGTPRRDEFALEGEAPATIAPAAFVGRLPQRLLAAGALAVVGHVDRTWSWSFVWPGAGEQLDTFGSTLALLLQGAPVGAAVDYFNDRYAALATELDAARSDVLAGRVPDDPAFSGLWTAKNDARNYAIFGDPAVRLPGAHPRPPSKV